MPPLSPTDIDAIFQAAQILFLSSARPLGFAILFTAFYWVHLNSGLLRLAFAIAIAWPVAMPALLGTGIELAGMRAAYPVLIAKEIFIGLLLGFVLSLPFEAVAAAGATIDAYRGASTGMSVSGGETTPYGQMIMVVTLLLFAVLGGFWTIVDILYSTYSVWPMLAPAPSINVASSFMLVQAAAKLFTVSLVLAAPLLIIMIVIDIAFGVSGKLGKQLNVTDLAISTRSLIVLLMTPIFLLVLVRMISGEFSSLPEFAARIRDMLR